MYRGGFLLLSHFPYTIQHAEWWIDYRIEEANKGDNREAYEFAVELKSEKKVIGGASLNKIDRFHGTAGGGIRINAKYHGCGYGTEAFGKKDRVCI